MWPGETPKIEVLYKIKLRLYSTSHLSSQCCCYIDVTAGPLTADLERGGEFKFLNTNATGECLTYLTENIEPANVSGNRSISLSDVEAFTLLPYSIASYHGSVMSVVMICCRRS